MSKTTKLIVGGVVLWWILERLGKPLTDGFSSPAPKRYPPIK